MDISVDRIEPFIMKTTNLNKATSQLIIPRYQAYDFHDVYPPLLMPLKHRKRCDCYRGDHCMRDETHDS